MFLNVFRDCLGQQWVPEEVHFERPRPADSYEHEKAFGAPVYFSLPRNALLFRPEIMSERMPQSDAKLMAMMQMCLRQLASEQQKCASFTDRVKAIVRAQLPDGYPSLENVGRIASHHASRNSTQAGERGADLPRRSLK